MRRLASVDHAASAVRTVRAEIAGLEALVARLENGLRDPFEVLVAAVASASGRVVVTGMGKSGHVARKVASTLASTGTPSFYLHPGEASHGDLGMVASGDVVLALSWSGANQELSDLVSYCKRFGVPLAAMTSEPQSALAKAADIVLILPNASEACLSTHAPTTSTTMQLAFGDALAIALLEAHGFSASDFRDLHPGGKLSAKLITVGELMGKGEAMPKIRDDATLHEAIVEMTAKRYGGAAVVDGEGRLVGAFTDGDLRRALAAADLSARVGDHMSRSPVSADPGLLATEALRMMNESERPFMLMFVVEEGLLVGAVHMHDFLRAGIA
ncbi:MAG: KpsF/GutQ family sugar-phosphate isomerase [Caulobacteraceae bacterium]